MLMLEFKSQSQHKSLLAKPLSYKIPQNTCRVNVLYSQTTAEIKLITLMVLAVSIDCSGGIPASRSRRSC